MKKICLILILLAAFPISAKAQCSPFQGLGAAQFLDNSGVPLTNGVLYSFQGGTSTQQATFTDSTCTVQNVNPITFTTGARVNIWLTTGNFYKFQLCLQNDGPTCAPSDVLFSVDQVPGGATGGGGGSGPPFVTGSPNPATTGILRCASGDACVVFRNAANSANLAIAKDSSDALSWASGVMKFPEISCSLNGTGFDYLCASSTNHRWLMANNGGSQTQIVGAGVDVNTSDQVTQLHFGTTATPLSSTAPTTSPNQLLMWNGTNIVGQAVESAINLGFNTNIFLNGTACSLTAGVQTCIMTTFAGAHTLLRFTWNMNTQAAGCSTNAVIGVRDLTAPSTLFSVTVTTQATGFVDSGALSVSMPAGHTIGIGLITPAAGCGTNAIISSPVMVYE